MAVYEVYREQLIPLIVIHTRATEEGIRVNKAFVKPALERQLTKMAEALKIARAYLGYPINLGSPEQLPTALYKYLGLSERHNKKTKKVTVNDEAIATLRQKALAYDAEEESEQGGLTVEAALLRCEQGANPLLEARVVYAGALQAIGHYLAPLVKI